MVIYGLNALNGLANTYLLLLYWGFSAGPANYLPYVIITASLSLHFVCTVISLYRPKISAAISLACSLFILFWQSQLMGEALKSGQTGLIVFILFSRFMLDVNFSSTQNFNKQGNLLDLPEPKCQ